MESSYRITIIIENTDADKGAVLDAAHAAAAAMAASVNGDADEDSITVEDAETEGDRADRMHG